MYIGLGIVGLAGLFATGNVIKKGKIAEKELRAAQEKDAEDVEKMFKALAEGRGSKSWMC